MININLTVLPEVAEFVGRVRLRLSDLEPEVRDELTDGLEADLSELVAEHGGSQPLGEISNSLGRSAKDSIRPHSLFIALPRRCPHPRAEFSRPCNQPGGWLERG